MQEVILNKEVVFEIVNNKIDTKHKECPRCHKLKRNKCFSFNKVLKLNLCNMCNKSVGTNPFYNQNFGKSKGFIGKFNMNEEEKKHLINNLIKKGVPYLEAKKRVENDIKVLSDMRDKKTYHNALNEQINITKKEEAGEMKANFLNGLGFKEKR